MATDRRPLAILAALALAACATPQDAAPRATGTIALPASIEYPEGVAVDAQGRIYVASALDAAVVRFAPDAGSPELFVGPNVITGATATNFPRALGIKVDRLGRLWVAGGRTGQVSVVGPDRHILARLTMPGESGVLNDAAILPDAVYVTDTTKPVLWRIPTPGGAIGAPEAWLDFTGTPLQFGPGRNLNGIVADATGKYLVVVQMDEGVLYRIDIASKAVNRIDVGGEAINDTDGLVLDGQTLYLVRQSEREIVTMSMAADFSSGEVVSRFANPGAVWLATAAIRGDELLVVDTQFNRRAADDAQRPFRLVTIPLELLEGK